MTSDNDTAQDISTGCVVCEDGKNAQAFGLLCIRHYRSMTDMVADIMEDYSRLGQYLEPSSAAIDTDVRRGKRADHPAPIRLDIAALSDPRTGPALNDGDIVPVIGIVSGWARIVREERSLAPSTSCTMRTESTLLLAHSAWIAEQPWVDEYIAEMRTAWKALRHAVGVETAKPVGICPVDMQGIACRGPLWADPSGDIRVQCGKCKTVWEENDIRLLGNVSGLFV